MTRQKPSKPYPEFPLNPHAKGKWAKKIAGKTHYFGRWEDPFGALREYEALIAGDKTPETPKQSVLVDYVNAFLDAKASKLTEGTIVKRTLDEYRASAIKFVDAVGRSRPLVSLKPSDFSQYRQSLVARGLGSTTIANEIQRIRTIVKWIYATYLPDTQPQFGPDFVRPSRTSARKQKAAQKSRLLNPESIHAILAEASIDFRAMVLLGINAAFGPTDCARLPFAIAVEAINTGWLIWPRTKTGVHREAALWPETIAALHTSLSYRRSPIGKIDAFFIAPDGYDYDCEGKTYLIPGRWRSAKQAARIEDGSFYSLRHTFNTIARQSGDAGAVKVVMGHVDGTISEIYDHAIGLRSIDDERHLKIQNRVRNWLFASRQPCVAIDPYRTSPLTSRC